MKAGVIQNTSALTKASEVQVLREGSSVFVRILQKSVGNQYKVSINGRSVFIKSELPLEVGKSFFAKVVNNGYQNGKLQVLLKAEGEKTEGFMMISDSNIEFENGEIIKNPAIAQWFRKNGMIPDKFSYDLFNELKKLNLKFDPALIINARKIGEKFGNDKKNAAMTAIVSFQKKIKSSEKFIQKVTGNSSFDGRNNEEEESDFHEESSFERNGLNQKKKEEDVNFALTDKDVSAVFKKFFSSIINGKTNSSKKGSALALFNHTGFDFKKPSFSGSWIKIPFGFEYEKGNDKNVGRKEGNGCLCFFMNPDGRKNLETVINFDFIVTKYKFVLYFVENKVIRMKIFHDSGNERIDFKNLAEKLSCSDFQVFSKVNSDDFYADDSDSFSVDGIV